MQRSAKSPTIQCDVESQWLRDLKDSAPRSSREGSPPASSSTQASGKPPLAVARAARRSQGGASRSGSAGSGSAGSGSAGSGSERRSFARFKTLLSGMVSDNSMQSGCRILDLSLGGARIGGLKKDQPLPERFSVRIDRFGLTEGRLLWQSGDQAGVRFDGEPTAIAALFGAFVPKHCRRALTPQAAG